MATYNGEKFLKEQIDSILSQTAPPLEIIVVDDGSSDSTLKILSTYSEYGVSVYRNEENIGVQNSFARGIGLAKADIVALCDQDDIWLPVRLERLCDAMGESDLVYSDAELIDYYGNRMEQKLSDRISIYGTTFSRSLFAFMLFNSLIWGSTILFRRTLYAQFSPVPHTFRNHDWWLQVSASFAKGIAYTPECLTLRRIHEQNYSVLKAEMALSKIWKRVAFRASPTSLEPQLRLLYAIRDSGLPFDDGELTILDSAIRAYRAGPSLELAIFSYIHRDVIFYGKGVVERALLALTRI